MGKKIKYNCIFGGGGIRGICYIGVVKALQELNIEIDAIAGSSVGAVFSSFYAIGYSPDEIKKIMYEFSLNMFRDININIFSPDISMSKGEIFLDWLREKIERKFYDKNYKKGENKPVTFFDIDKNLQILTVDLNTNTPYIFSKETTPDVEIAFAIRASASLPGLMKPVNFNDAILVDGDLIKSWPAWKVYNTLNNPDSRILEFRIEGSRINSDLKNPQDYVNSLINTIWYLSTENIFDLYSENDRYDYIIIDTKDIILFDFNLDTEIKNGLIEKGYNETKNYFVNILSKKRQQIKACYEKIFSNIIKFKKYIKDENPEKAVFVINETLSTMCETTKYIDEYYYNLLTELKQFLISNIKKSLFLQKKINNIKQIILKTEFLEGLLQERISDLDIY
ncbi:MAG: patatin-like phospholipase family protein [Candidatus Avigastranaerophilus sp.]